MTAKRKIANPLALAVLACLFERPMHPYEIATTLRERHKDESIKLNYGSLYTIVEGLTRHKLIEAQDTSRDGNRPERTVYRITAAGRHELTDWLSDLICQPVQEYTQFEAGLSLLPVLPPADAAALLDQRVLRLEVALAQAAALRGIALEHKLPRLYWIEAEYRWMLKSAELEWVRMLAAEIREGRIEGIAEWRRFHKEEHEEPTLRLIEPSKGS